MSHTMVMGFPGGASGKETLRDVGSIPGLGRSLEEERTTTPVFLPGESHGQRSLVGCSPWGFWESDTTERLHFHFLLSSIEEGNGNPLQCSCLENPRDGGAWWATIYGSHRSDRTEATWQQQQQHTILLSLAILSSTLKLKYLFSEKISQFPTEK